MIWNFCFNRIVYRLSHIIKWTLKNITGYRCVGLSRTGYHSTWRTSWVMRSGWWVHMRRYETSTRTSSAWPPCIISARTTRRPSMSTRNCCLSDGESTAGFVPTTEPITEDQQWMPLKGSPQNGIWQVIHRLDWMHYRRRWLISKNNRTCQTPSQCLMRIT